jgi:hypothetical protein
MPNPDCSAVPSDGEVPEAVQRLVPALTELLFEQHKAHHQDALVALISVFSAVAAHHPCCLRGSLNVLRGAETRLAGQWLLAKVHDFAQANPAAVRH